MRYIGGKKRIAKPISDFLKSLQEENHPYAEPFFGMGSVMARMTARKRIGIDNFEPVVALWNALQAGWIPPDSVSEEEYQRIRADESVPAHLRAFVGIGCSFGGKWFGGYARSLAVPRNYALNARNELLRMLPSLMDVAISHGDYADFEPRGYLIYCDPPYAGKTGFGHAPIDHEQFWDTMRRWSTRNTVVISEYVAPEDFTCVLEMTKPREVVSSKGKSRSSVIERLWMLK